MEEAAVFELKPEGWQGAGYTKTGARKVHEYSQQKEQELQKKPSLERVSQGQKCGPCGKA